MLVIAHNYDLLAPSAEPLLARGKPKARSGRLAVAAR
jgi:hypothetical protein